MASATFKSSFLIIPLAFSLLWLSGCGNDADRFERDLNRAIELREAGQHNSALQRLEQLSNDMPGDARILTEQGRNFIAQNDLTTGAFFLAQAARIAPDDRELLLEAYAAQIEAGERTEAASLAVLLETVAPDAMGPREWLLVGEKRAAANETRPALEAYHRAIRLNGGNADAETALAVGQLFAQVQNRTQAERWLNEAKADEETQIPAQFALLDLYLAESAWAQAEAQMAEIDESFPGAIEGSQYAETREELKRWRAAREEAVRRAAESAVAVAPAVTLEPELEPEPEPDASEPVASEPPVTEPTPMTAPERPVTPTTTTPEEVVETDAADRHTPRPSVKLAEDEPAATEPEPAATGEPFSPDPRITVQPADPDLNISVTFDGAQPGQIIFRSETRPDAGVDDTAAAAVADVRTGAIDIPTGGTGPSVQTLRERANQEAVNGNHREAIRLYWQALGQEPEEAELWNLLSRSYFIEGERRNAETTALEAIRLDPNSIPYTLHYLRVAQQILRPADFVREVERAQERFPRSPDITLSLARAYDRILDNWIAARREYNRFLALAPEHPLRSEAENALQRLR